ncbi:MAG TPA: hypothetical protein VF281_01400 [Candidatus Saccharimonadales bacterium]
MSSYEHESFISLSQLVEKKREELKSKDAATGMVGLSEVNLEPFRAAIAQELNRMVFYLQMKNNDGSLSPDYFITVKAECNQYLVRAPHPSAVH